MWLFKKKKKKIKPERQPTEEEVLLTEALEKFKAAYEDGRLKEDFFGEFLMTFKIGKDKYKIECKTWGRISVDFPRGTRVSLSENIASKTYNEYIDFMRKAARDSEFRYREKNLAAAKILVGKI